MFETLEACEVSLRIIRSTTSRQFLGILSRWMRMFKQLSHGLHPKN